jgi:UDP-4-amino-4,6-dideoxy-N-acetyl-beta-L-altrosamine N-acetyltransferase
MIGLRRVSEADEERLFLWRRRPAVDRWMRGEAFRTREAHERWFRALCEDHDRRGWIIVDGAAPVGLLILSGLDGADRRGDWGWYIGDDHVRGRGVGRAAQALGLDRAFGELSLRKVSAEVLSDNVAALRAQAAVGFQREGYLRRHLIKNGVERDVVILGLLAQSWAERRPRLMAELAATGFVAADVNER